MMAMAGLVDDSSHPSRQKNQWRNILIAVVLTGCLCRCAQYLSNRSYWHDEALLTLNIMNRSAADLIGRLDYDQAAPPLFLWIERGIFVSFGRSEYVMRAVPLAASIGTLGLFAILSWRLLSPAAAVIAVGLLAWSDRLIWHASEVKQYSSDTFCAVLFLYLALGARRPVSDVLRLAILSLCAFVMVWISHPAAICFAAVSMVLFLRIATTEGGAVKLAVPTICIAIAASSFLFLYHESIRHHDPDLDEFWRPGFIDWTHPFEIPLWFFRQTYSICDHPYPSLGSILLLLAGLGTMAWWKARRDILLAGFIFPFGLTVLAAALHKFPYTGDRVTVYLLPGLFLVVAGGFQSLGGMLGARRRNLAWLLPLPLLIDGSAQAAYHLIVPRSISHIRPAVQYVRSHRRKDEALYIVSEDFPSHSKMSLELFCYWPHPDPPVFNGIESIRDIQARRFWLIFTFQPRHGVWHIEPFLQSIRESFRQVDEMVDPTGGAAILFESKNTAAARTVRPQ